MNRQIIKPVGPRSAFCEMLRAKRLEKQLTQTEVAKLLGLSHSAVSLWEVNGVIPDPPKFQKVAKLLELPPEAYEEYAKLKKTRHKGEKYGT